MTWLIALSAVVVAVVALGLSWWLVMQLQRQQGLGDLEAKRQAVDHAVRGLEEKLARYEALVTQFEKDRDRKYGQLEEKLEHVTKETGHLQQTTASLVAVLGNSRVRGQWGQRMAEDILRLCGLQAGIHYEKEQGVGTGRPDYVFRLPDGHQLFMDVKFPLDHYLKFAEARHPDEQARHREAFMKSVREHLREMDRRAYGRAEGAVDYTILFIPNEQVYGALNEWMPQLIDDGLKKKLILCGPWTLYAILRIVHEAWHNYQFSIAVRDIVATISGFLHDYARFKERFGELGEQLEKAASKYQEIAVTSAQRLESKIRRIEEYRKGQGIPSEAPEPPRLTVEELARRGEEA